MAQKKAAPTDDELSAMFAGIGDDEPDQSMTASVTTTQPSTNTKPTPTSSGDDDEDPLAELASLAAAPRAISRPSTPHISSSAATSVQTRSPRQAGAVVHTPPSSGSARSSLEKSRSSGEGVTGTEQRRPRTPAAPVTPAQQSSPVVARSSSAQGSPTAAPAAKSGGSWWGGLSAIASAAVKQAENAVKEIQKNEEAQKWAEQVKGNVGALRGLGGQISSRALPAFTDILHTLAPPISQHERLQIHITHDLVGYPSLEPIVYSTFNRVMSQVEGGDLLVIQRGSESGQRRTSDAAYSGSGSSGWNDGPWWRESETQRSLGTVKGLSEGTKLVLVSARSYADEFYAARGGMEESQKQASEAHTESNPVRRSDIFIAIQAISYVAPTDMFVDSTATTDESVVDESATSKPDSLVTFAIHLHDPVHSISFSALSQPLPQQWADWLDAAAAAGDENGLPEAIIEIIESGGVDPREWVSEWIEETMSLAIGVVAQRYVARRMGVGEGRIGRGKRREMIVESGGGEAARAI